MTLDTRFFRAAIVALGLTGVLGSATAQTSAPSTALPVRPPPRVGQPFGPLVLPTLDGSRSVDLDTYRGRKVLLIEFASW